VVPPLEVVASAPAKAILFGEHFVVYGQPAIVLAIDKRAYVKVRLRKDKKIHIYSKDMEVSGCFSDESFQPERGGLKARRKLEPIKVAVEKVLNKTQSRVGLNLEVCSSIPVAAGLGSSAAVAAATAMATSKILNVELSKEEIFQVAYDSERLIHGTPSGIDPAIATYGGALLYQRGKGLTPLSIKGEMPLVVGDTGIERSTGELVAKVRRLRERYPLLVDALIELGGELVSAAVEALKKKDLHSVGELMNINHSLLSAIGVSHELLDRLVHAARRAGALGAKLTGAGGGGCMIALALPETLERVASAIEQVGVTAFVAKKTEEGVRIEG